jgi:hypothetical protein
MTEYSSLLVGGAKKARKAVSPEMAEKRLAALAKGRATAAKNREMKGKGLLGSAAAQDIVDTDQVMYAGNPLDVLPGKYTAPVVMEGDGKKKRIPKIKATRHEAALIGVGQDLVVGSGKVKAKKLSKKDMECIAMAEAEDGVKSVSDEGEMAGGKRHKSKAKSKAKKVDMLPEAIRRLGDIASNFVITLKPVPKINL